MRAPIAITNLLYICQFQFKFLYTEFSPIGLNNLQGGSYTPHAFNFDNTKAIYKQLKKKKN